MSQDIKECLRDEIIESFGATAAPNVSCEFRDGYYTISCPNSDDTSLFGFINIVREFIEVDCDKEPDMFEDVKVTRKKGTISESTPNMDDLAELATQPLRLTSGHVNNGHSSRPENGGLLIEHETVKRTWTPDQSGREIGSKISDNINQMSFPRVFSFPIVEGEPSFQLEMRALKDIGDRRCPTTLLPLNSPIFKSIQNALVVSMIRNGCRIPIQQKRIKGASNGAISPWKDHLFNSFRVDQGQELTPATAPNAALGDALATSTTTEWVAKTATAAEFVNPFQPDSVAEGQSDLSREPKATTTVAYEEPPEPILIQKPNTKRTRVAKGRGKAVLTKAGTVGANVFNDPTQATIPKSPASTRDPREGNDDSNKTFD
ncbi:hypothetical protein ABVK25_001282 [Lepraria finkii]|uniref:Uncharacterized protein n=1 Tax=Lepraria finkii TaxID=1340010 RepID=A0ABR4BL74_9LECA